jgi:zinc-ribbon domain
MAPDVCPNCGADVPRNAKVCPECGSDETTGWSETAYESSLGSPNKEFDYDKFVGEEFGVRRAKPRGVGWFWWVVALLLTILLLFLFLH